MSAPRSAPPSASFTALLRTWTASLHRQAERSGFIARIIAGSVTRTSYAVFLRNLLPAYRELEAGLEQHRDRLGALLRPELVRTSALECDLVHLAGSAWADELPILPAGASYAARVAAGARDDAALLIAHAYTRYLGDLGGGPILKRRLAATLGLRSQGLSFYEFPAIGDLASFAGDYRSALDDAARGVGSPERVLDEARVAFCLNIALSEAVAALLQD
jgi:heme oxygenase